MNIFKEELRNCVLRQVSLIKKSNLKETGRSYREIAAIYTKVWYESLRGTDVWKTEVYIG
jgi:hypothetical protein